MAQPRSYTGADGKNMKVGQIATDDAARKLFTAPCELCGDEDGWRGFHAIGCENGVQWKAQVDVGAEKLIRECCPDYSGPYVAWRNAAARALAAGDGAKANYYGRIVSRVAELKGDAGVKEELAREEAMKCRACEELEVVRDVAGEDYSLPANSERHEAAHEMAAWLEEVGLQPSQQAVVERDASSKFYRICWSYGEGEGIVGGEVNVYGQEWVRVAWDGDVEYMPIRGSRVYDSLLAAQTFLELAVLKQDWTGAQEIPIRETRSQGAER